MIGGQDNTHGEDAARVANNNADNRESTRIYLAVPRAPHMVGHQVTSQRVQRLIAANDNRPPTFHDG